MPEPASRSQTLQLPEEKPCGAPAGEAQSGEQGARSGEQGRDPYSTLPAPRSLPANSTGTDQAPSCPAPLDTAASKGPPLTLDDLEPGRRIDDFEIEILLGRGAFGAVYLARQISLDRQIALKVTLMPLAEGRKMGRLEHEHIVQVFSETAIGNIRLLCMQYVPGASLQEVLVALEDVPYARRNGQVLLDTIDRLTVRAAAFDPAAARNRELLAGLDWSQTVCWLGARLAEALDCAHARGVFHRDIKPGNIMLSQYGRPLLVDFNMAARQIDAGSGENRMGGTLAYMAPEHLDVFVSGAEPPPETVAQAADVYALGVVLYQSACGDLPFPRTPEGKSSREVLQAMADQRRALPPPLPPEVPRALDQVVARCMQPDPRRRFASGQELSAALEGCRHAIAAEREMPDFGRMRAVVAAHPFIWLMVLALAPQIAATVLNIAYNQVRIISHLSEVQQSAFGTIILCYNAYGYATGLAIALFAVLPVWRAWKAAGSREQGAGSMHTPRTPLPAPSSVDAARRLAVAWPLIAAIVSSMGWMPGGVVFGYFLKRVGGSLDGQYWAHLIVSFAVSGLIAATYSMLLVQWLVLSVIYPRLWTDRQDFRSTAAVELRAVPRRLLLLQILAGVIPLAGAAMILIGWNEGDSLAFRLLVTSLIVLGAAGFCLAMFATGLLSRALAALVSK